MQLNTYMDIRNDILENIEKNMLLGHWQVDPEQPWTQLALLDQNGLHEDSSIILRQELPKTGFYITKDVYWKIGNF